MLSGGLDSVWALWRHLEDTNERIRTHHVHLVNRENRHLAEAQAVHSVLAYMSARGWRDRIVHSESTTKWGNLRHIPRDHHTWGYWAGVILSDPKNQGITRVIRTFHVDSVEGGPDSPMRARADDAWRRPIEFISERPIELVHPMIHMTKAQVIADLPADLRELCWWCRRPNGGRPCGSCHTCRQVNAALPNNPTPQFIEGSDIMPPEELVTLVALHSFHGLEGKIRRGSVFQATVGRAAYLKSRGLAKDAPQGEGSGEPGPTRDQAEPGPSRTSELPDPIHIGGGWYNVHGEKVQGKEAAQAALKGK